MRPAASAVTTRFRAMPDGSAFHTPPARPGTHADRVVQTVQEARAACQPCACLAPLEQPEAGERVVLQTPALSFAVDEVSACVTLER